MTAQSWFKALMQQLSTSYTRAYTESVKLGEVPLEDAQAFKSALRDGVEFSDLLVASDLRRRAIGQKTDTSGGFTVEALRKRNPWVRAHRVRTAPVVQEQVDAVVAAESTYLARAASARKRLADPNAAIARSEMCFRHAVSVTSAASEQAQLQVPEIGYAFPVGEYFSREDRRVRPTHKAMNGFVAARTEQIWEIVRPPCGFNCRCGIRWVAWREAIARGFATEKKQVLLTVRFPNSAAKHNFDQRIFPDAGWRGPKIMAGASALAA